ncbi:MarR family winged helix-turn-helix transcriptional regulator [Shimia sp. SDUM112013]|uniref:MarR family winged helix-turn-helix transcriptional regulator n=1 Tax=Shimia sp. SDUM112013 TaxID=3136160 RepID=UPI0032EF412D
MNDTTDLPDDLFLVDVPETEARTLSFSRSTTVMLTFAANRFTRQAARDYQDRFGIGAMDWRMLVMLTRAPGSSVAKASRTIGIDKGAVSRSLSRLHAQGLVQAESADSDARRKAWTLTDKGQALHDRILSEALSRQRALLKGFSEQEVEQLNGYLARLLANLEAPVLSESGPDPAD